MGQSEDYTIFVWRSRRPEPHRRGLLAQSPSELESSSHEARMQDTVQVTRKTWDQQLYIPAALTSRVLVIVLPLRRKDSLVKAVLQPDHLSITRSRGTTSTPTENSFLGSGTYLALICRSANESGRIALFFASGFETSGKWHFHTAFAGNCSASEFTIHTTYVLPSSTEG